MTRLAGARSVLAHEGLAGLWQRARREWVLAAIGRLSRSLQLSTTGDPFHLAFGRFLTQANLLRDHRILEIGSRNVSGNLLRDRFHDYRDYVGFDIHAGDNVDSVGDVHQLSQYFPADHFDVVFSISVFEHLAMPWKAVLEINRVMKPGGLLCVTTHPTWPAHELPWDFYRYSAEAFKALLNPLTGFNIVHCAEGLPCLVIPCGDEPSMRGLHRHPANLGVCVLAEKCGPAAERLAWDARVDEILSTSYPVHRKDAPGA